jgi:hypothetical protein
MIKFNRNAKSNHLSKVDHHGPRALLSILNWAKMCYIMVSYDTGTGQDTDTATPMIIWKNDII